MIEIKNLSFKYKGSDKPALIDINLNINKEEFIGITGESGAGKSTLAYAINGIIPHHYEGDYYGNVMIDGKDTFDIELSEIALNIGSVFQDIDTQMVSSVVEEEILYGLENFGVSHDEIEERIDDSLAEVGISELRKRKISTLSGGQKQKVAIASIIAIRPHILLFDEPTGELDPKSSREIFRMLNRFNKEYKMTIIVIEQKINLLCEYADRLVIMNKGRVVSEGDIRKVLKDVDIKIPDVVKLSNELTELQINDGEVALNVDEASAMVRRFVYE